MPLFFLLSVDIYMNMTSELRSFEEPVPVTKIARWLPNEAATFVQEDVLQKLIGRFKFSVLYQESGIVLFYFCQSLLFFFRNEDAVVLSRDQNMYDRQVFYNIDAALQRNGAHVTLYDLNQLRC